MGVIAAGQRGKGHFLIARGVFQLFRLGKQGFQAPFAHGTIEHARLAEAAALGAAAHDLQHDAVMDGFGIGHHEGLGIGGAVQIPHDALAHNGGSRVVDGMEVREGAVVVIAYLIESGNIDALDPGQCPQGVQAGKPRLFALAHAGNGLHHHFLAVADLEHVHKGGQGLGIVSAGTARHDDGAVLTIPGIQGDPSQVQHLQHVGIAHFILQGEPHDIETIQGRAGFDGKKRQFFPAHGVRHIGPGHEGPLAQRPGLAIDDVVEDLDAQMGHAYLIGIGKTKGKGHFRLIKGLDDGVHFAAGIPRGLEHSVKQLFKTVGREYFHGSSSKHNTSICYHTINDNFCPRSVCNFSCGQQPDFSVFDHHILKNHKIYM